MANHFDVCHKHRNTLLMWDDEGKAKPTAYDLPAFSHAYGYKPPNLDKYTTAECVNDWKYPKLTPKPEGRQVVYPLWNKYNLKQHIRKSQVYQSLPNLLAGEDQQTLPINKRPNEKKMQRLQKLHSFLEKNPMPTLLTEKEDQYASVKKFVKRKMDKVYSVPDIAHGETVKRHLPKVPDDMKKLMEGGYERDGWNMYAELYKQHHKVKTAKARPPQPTNATKGHAIGNRMKQAAYVKSLGNEPGPEWRLSKFKNIQGSMKLQKDGSMLCFDH